MCALLQQDNSTAHITANSTQCLQGASSDSIMSQGLWRPHSKWIVITLAQKTVWKKAMRM